MSSTLTLIDRYVLEAINKKQKGIIQLNIDTGIEVPILQKVLNRLTVLKLTSESDGLYSINLKVLKGYTASKRHEVSNMMKEISLESKQVSIKKVHLNQSELQRVQSMFQEIECFIESKSSSSKAIKEKFVIYWGQQNYAELIKNYLS